ncbi:MAG: hypothetical protein IJW19_04010 [Clostridia bacterium]|nr:hypothetical protein [Clostridia bacterium]
MIENRHKKYVAFNSSFLSATFEKDTGKMAFLGIESGGRNRDRHATFNLLLPSCGATSSIFKKYKPSVCEVTDNSFIFKGENGKSSTVEFTNDKNILWSIDGITDKDILRMDLAIKTAPPTVWSESVCKKKKKTLKSRNPLCAHKTKYSLPIYIHFPDFGFLKIESDNDGVYCVEEMLKSAERNGLGLGYGNYEYHTHMNALHYGSCAITFRSDAPSNRVTLRLTVLDEIYPTLPFDNDDSWNGLKRCWMNSFTLNRKHFDMGDNICLTGIAHLSVHMKSDLLQVMGEDKPVFDMVRRVFENQIMNGFLYGQVEDGEVNFDYVGRKKTNPMCDFIDSTPGSVIATVGISKWNMEFAKRLLPYAIKAADFIMTLDTDKDGIFEVPFPGDYIAQEEEVGYRQRNWWDNFAFGHKDIYFNCLCHRALRELSELLYSLHREKEAEKYKAQLKKFDNAFFDTFYNPESTLLSGWISRNGKHHDYMFTFAVSMAIDEGLIPEDEGRRMLLLLLEEMKKEGYGDLRFGIPGNVKPVDPADTIDWPCMSDWGQYENGGLCGMNGFHFLSSMYKVGLDAEADEIFKAILKTYDNDFTHSGLMPGYVSSVDWRTKNGVPCGYNYLADNYYFLLAAFTGKGRISHPAIVR